MMESLQTMTAGVVAPYWLHESFTVLLQAAPGVVVGACAITLEELAAAMAEKPELVLLYSSSGRTGSQVEEIKAVWPGAHCIALVEHAEYQAVARQAGADIVLPGGLAPALLLEAVERLRDRLEPSLSEDKMAGEEQPPEVREASG